MHGVILSNFKHYLSEGYGRDIWAEVTTAAQLTGKTYVPIGMYPDDDFEALLAASEQLLGLCRNDLLEDFGEWVIGPLIGMYRAMIPQDWDVMDFLLNMEERIHQRIIRMKNPQAEPPRIGVVEVGPRMLAIHYQSERDLSAMALGCVRGVARFFDEQVDVLEDSGTEQGERHFVVKLIPQRLQMTAS